MFQSLGEHDRVKEYLEKALVIRTEIVDRKGKAADYRRLGTVFTEICYLTLDEFLVGSAKCRYVRVCSS